MKDKETPIEKVGNNLYDGLRDYFDVEELRDSDKKKLKIMIVDAVDKACELTLEECPDCDNYDERMGEPSINEGYL